TSNLSTDKGGLTASAFCSGPRQTIRTTMRSCGVGVLNRINGFMVLPYFSPAELIQLVAGPEETKNPAGKSPPPDSRPPNQVGLKCLLVYGTLVPHACGVDLISDVLPFGRL